MPKFEVTITERLTKSVIVDAKNKNEAFRKVCDDWRNEKIILYPEDFFDVNFEVLPNP